MGRKVVLSFFLGLAVLLVSCQSGNDCWRLMIVLSGSMRPAFSTGALVVVRTVDPASIRNGDIVTFKEKASPGRLITHRVVGMKQEQGKNYLITKGDANRFADLFPVPGENIIGRVVWVIPWLGFLVSFLQSETGLILLSVLCGLLTALIFWPRLTGRNKAI